MPSYCLNPACFQYTPCADHMVNIRILDAEIMSMISSFLDHNLAQWRCLRNVCSAWKDMSIVWLEHIDFVDCVDERELPALAKLVGVRSLLLNNTKDADWVPQISTLTSLTKLWTLHLTSSDIEKLCCFPLLHTLVVDSFTDDDVCKLEPLQSLRHLCANESGINGNSLSVLTQLDSLELSRCKNLTVLSCLVPLTHLRRLWIDGFKGDLTSLSHLVGLEELHLPDTQTTDESLEYLRPLSALRKLALGGTSVSNEGLVTLGSFLSLQDLSLWDCPITGNGISSLRSLKLTRLDLNGTAAHDEQAMVTGLALLTSLTNLDLNETDLSNAGLTVISVLTNLCWLSLEFNGGITDEGVQSITVFKSLTYLNLKWTEITDAGVHLLTFAPQLRELDLTSCQVTDRCLPVLASFRNLDCLMMCQTLISDEGLVFLSSLTTLRELGVADCSHTTCEGLLVLSSLTRLKSLFLTLDQSSPEFLKQFGLLTMGRTAIECWS